MIAAVVLAAGQSRRMGTQKLLLPYDGLPLIARVVDELLRSPVEQVSVVVGRDAAEIQRVLGQRNVHFVANPQADSEMLHSVRCGLTALPSETEAAIVALADQPAISASIVANLVDAYRRDGRGIVVPSHQGRRGHPLLISMRYRDEILSSYEGQGLRGLLAAHPQDVFQLEVASAGVLDDIDLPEDYQRAIRTLATTRRESSSND